MRRRRYNSPLDMLYPHLRTGVAVSANTLTSDEIDKRFGLPAGTVFKRYGVRSRRYAT
jgi:hypothetical protein